MSKFIAAFLGFVAFLGVGNAFADDPNPLTLNGGVNVTNNYYLRGLKQETNGVIVQPSANVNYSLYHNDKAVISDVRVFGGVFESIQTTGTNSNGSAGAWFESDVSAGGGFTLAKTVNLDAFYFGSTSPSGAFSTVQEVDLRVSLNDHDLWANTFFGQNLPNFTGFRPYALWADEFSGHLANRVAVSGSGLGSYLELGVNPGFNVYKNVVLTFPVKVGFSTNNYYNDGSGVNYGYTSVGTQLEVPLCSHASLTAGVDGVFLGNAVKSLNGDGENVVVNGHVGLLFKF